MQRFRILVLVSVDVILLLLSYFAAAVVLRDTGWNGFSDLWSYLFDENVALKIAVVVGTAVFFLYFVGLYDKIRVHSRLILLQDLLVIFGIAFFPQALLSYGGSDLVLLRWIMALGSILSILLLFVWRLAYAVLLERVVGRQKVLFLGDSSLSRELASFLQRHPERGFDTIGCIAADDIRDFPGQSIRMEANLSAQIRQRAPDVISVSSDLDIGEELSRQLLECSMEGLAVESISLLHEELFHRVALETVTLGQLVYSPALRPRRWVELIQNFYSRLAAVIGLLIAWPVMLIVAIAVRLDSPGPAIFRQTRISKNGMPFQFLKFRSMRVANHAIPLERTKKNDPRVTRVGRWIRISRLDELPQFINVLRGEMLLVGPRPEMPEFERDLLKVIPLYRQRHRVKPGITGWAQIHHEPEDSTGSTVRKLEYDLFYIKNMSPGLDFVIMFQTIKTILLRIGAR